MSCSESTEQVEVSLERWRNAQETRGRKVSRSKRGRRMERTEIMMVDEFKYLESIIQNNGQHTRKVKKRAQEWVETSVRSDL